MKTPPWRERVRTEDELLEQLSQRVSAASKRRAEALAEGVAELGTVKAVAIELGRSWNAVDKAIKRHRPKITTT